MDNKTPSGRLPARQKYAFGIGAIGKDAICNLVGAFLMLYFTDTLGLSGTFVGILFFAARIWDAINDPVMGMVVDNTRHQIRQIPYLAGDRHARQLGLFHSAVYNLRHPE